MRPLLYFSLAVSLFLSTSCIEQGKIPKVPGVDGPRVNIQDGKVILGLTLEKVRLPAGISMNIPKMDYSTASLATSLGGGTVIQVALDLRDLESDHFRNAPPETLPDGRPFPFTAGGTLPAVAINVPSVLDTTFYASNHLFGFFVPINIPSDFKIPVGASVPLVINGSQIGVVGFIQPDHRGEGSGLVLIITKKQIEDNPDAQTLLKFSKKHPEALF